MNPIAAAAAGLLYISESESPLEYVERPWPQADDVTTVATVAAALGETGPARERTIEGFFAGHIEESDPEDPVARANVPRFRALVQVLGRELEAPKVYCFGEVAQRCYVVGRRGGALAGLKVEVFET